MLNGIVLRIVPHVLSALQAGRLGHNCMMRNQTCSAEYCFPCIICVCFTCAGVTCVTYQTRAESDEGKPLHLLGCAQVISAAQLATLAEVVYGNNITK